MERLPPRRLFAVTPVGPEQSLNVVTADVQQDVSVAVNGTGGYIAVWAGDSQDITGWGVFARRFDADGKPIGGEFRVNQTINGDQNQPVIAMRADGGFIVAWTSNQSGNTDVFARMYNAAGASITPEFFVNQTKSGAQQNASIGIDAAGNFIVAWDGAGASDKQGIYVRSFRADGLATSDEIPLNSTRGGVQDDPSVAVDATGRAVIAWSDHQGGTSKIRAQRVETDGVLAGTQFAVTDGLHDEDHPAAGIDSSGNSVIAFDRNDGSTSRNIYVRRYDATGNTIGDASIVNTFMADDQIWPTVATNADGRFAVAWASGERDGDGSGIFAQLFDPDGRSVGAEFRVNSTVTLDQHTPASSWNGNHMVVGWSGNGIKDATGVYAQLLHVTVDAPVEVPDPPPVIPDPPTDPEPEIPNPPPDRPLFVAPIVPENPPSPNPLRDEIDRIIEMENGQSALGNEQLAIDDRPDRSGSDLFMTASIMIAGGLSAGGGVAVAVASDVAPSSADGIANSTDASDIAPDTAQAPQQIAPEPIANAGDGIDRGDVVVPSSGDATQMPSGPTDQSQEPAGEAVLAADRVAFVAAPGKLWNDLDALQDKVTAEMKAFRLMAGTASFVSLGIGVAYVVWSARAGFMLASLLASLPAWRFVDPLPILNDSESSAARRKRKAAVEGESLGSFLRTSVDEYDQGGLA